MPRRSRERVAHLLCLLSLLWLAASGEARCGEPARVERPNVVVILVDDMGLSDIGCYGSEIPTPHLDALAENGLCFTQFYNTGRCCPTRASLLTGLYPHQAGVGHMTSDYGVPGYRGSLNKHCVTLGDIARGAGYLAAARQPGNSTTSRPTARNSTTWPPNSRAKAVGEQPPVCYVLGARRSFLANRPQAPSPEIPDEPKKDETV